MKPHIFVVFCLFCQLSCTSQNSTGQILISIPSIEQEASSIWRTINDIDFLEQQGYTIHLPEDDSIQSLIAKSKNKKFSNTDFAEIYNLLDSSIYDKKNYAAALSKVKAQEELLNASVKQLNVSKKTWNWDFKMFETYDVVFTLYGTGGSYDPDLGLVTLFTNSEGKFMNYAKPANTIIHEIVHMGIEKSIVQEYNLPHGLKERIVDIITYSMFKEQLPAYKIQNMGDPKIDDYLKGKGDLKDLKSIVEKYLQEK